MKKRLVSTLLIIIGIGFLVFPKLSEIYYMKEQQKLIKEWEEYLAIIEQEDSDDFESFEGIDFDKEREFQRETAAKAREEQRRLEKEKKAWEEYLKKNMEGIIKIEKANIKLPILKGVSEGNMATTVAHMEYSGDMGQIGNYVIVGHRSYAYGRNFNRLDEIDKGDIIEVSDGENQYIYTVVDKLYVLPEEKWVVDKVDDKKEITLITCHPVRIATHRLIIKGQILD